MSRRSHTGHRIGEWHGKAKLTTEQVRAMRSDYIPGIVGYVALAGRYGCGVSTARDICTGVTRWAD
ncbi:hypothetical protein SAMN05216229_12356 [Geopseudomonas sagittaria]|uniref:Uncharacterized protein n=1 Tax=Geopseudomonas sagittaria TaxID=1135990 RepID=A0A1I5YRC2_9GAMM|nr:hypothetical protein [Pseudomonas sagittaria]SFQ46702.1 hypothetical protein SAMN05216229_12356 [Pseudomonas sagittaria]